MFNWYVYIVSYLYFEVRFLLFFFFFFQAEDGIRDAQESRGLGDVYKRQVFAEVRGKRMIAIVTKPPFVHTKYKLRKKE